MAMDKVVELNREYWGRVHDMCEGTNVKPWECVRFNHPIMNKPRGFNGHPLFDQFSDEHTFEFAVTVLEDRPVFENNIVYRKADGYKFLVEGLMHNTEDRYLIKLNFDNSTVLWTPNQFSQCFTWTPPAIKRTFTLNGAELPCPINYNTVNSLGHPSVVLDGCYFWFKIDSDRREVSEFLLNLLTEARDK